MLHLLEQTLSCRTFNVCLMVLLISSDYTGIANSKGIKKAHTNDYISQRVAVVTSLTVLSSLNLLLCKSRYFDFPTFPSTYNDDDVDEVLLLPAFFG